MKIVVITGSPRKKGTSALLAEKFIQGAEEAGHSVFRFDAAFRNVHPCIACRRCRDTEEGCVFKDDMEALNAPLLAADMVVFVSPIYYYDWNAQLKCVIDRFYANSPALRVKKKCALFLTMEDDTMESASGAILSYQGMTRFLHWENVCILSALDCAQREDIEKTDYPQIAYETGRSL